MEAIDADLMIRLEREEQDAKRRYDAAKDRGDVEAMKVAAASGLRPLKEQLGTLWSTSSRTAIGNRWRSLCGACTDKFRNPSPLAPVSDDRSGLNLDGGAICVPWQL